MTNKKMCGGEREYSFLFYFLSSKGCKCKLAYALGGTGGNMEFNV